MLLTGILRFECGLERCQRCFLLRDGCGRGRLRHGRVLSFDNQNLRSETSDLVPAMTGLIWHVLSHQHPAITTVMDDEAYDLRFGAEQRPRIFACHR